MKSFQVMFLANIVKTFLRVQLMIRCEKVRVQAIFFDMKKFVKQKLILFQRKKKVGCKFILENYFVFEINDSICV